MAYPSCGHADVVGVAYTAPKTWKPAEPGEDEWGAVWEKSEVENMGQMKKHPLRDWANLETYRFPDPDEDSLTFRYSGWLANAWQASDAWFAEQEETDETNLTVPVPPQQPLDNATNLTAVYPPDCAQRCANRLLTESDVGDHTVTISVSDGQFTDYQEVRVKVEPGNQTAAQ